MQVHILFPLLSLMQICHAGWPFCLCCEDKCEDGDPVVATDGNDPSGSGGHSDDELPRAPPTTPVDDAPPEEEDDTDSEDLEDLEEPYFYSSDEEEQRVRRGNVTRFSLDLFSTESTLVSVEEHHDDGVLHRIYTPDDLAAVVVVMDGEKEVWKGTGDEKCIFAQCYIGETTLLSMEVYDNVRSRIRRFEKDGQEWRELRFREFSTKLNRMMKTALASDQEAGASGGSPFGV